MDRSPEDRLLDGILGPSPVRECSKYIEQMASTLAPVLQVMIFEGEEVDESTLTFVIEQFLKKEAGRTLKLIEDYPFLADVLGTARLTVGYPLSEIPTYTDLINLIAHQYTEMRTEIIGADGSQDLSYESLQKDYVLTVMFLRVLVLISRYVYGEEGFEENILDTMVLSIASTCADNGEAPPEELGMLIVNPEARRQFMRYINHMEQGVISTYLLSQAKMSEVREDVTAALQKEGAHEKVADRRARVHVDMVQESVAERRSEDTGEMHAAIKKLMRKRSMKNVLKQITGLHRNWMDIEGEYRRAKKLFDEEGLT